MKPALALRLVLMLGMSAGCSKSYSLAPGDGASDDTIVMGMDGPEIDAESDLPLGSDAAGGADAPITIPDGGSDATAEEVSPPDATTTEAHADTSIEVHGDAAPVDTKTDQASETDAHPDASAADVGTTPDGQQDAALDMAAEVGADAAIDTSAEAGTDGASPPVVLSIPTIRDPAASGHPSAGTVVQTSGVVTAVKTAGTTHTFFLQAPNVAKYAGVYVYVGSANVASLGPGAVVNVVGLLSNYRGIDRIDTTSGSFQITGVTAVPAPADADPADVATGGARAEELQSMLVHLNTTVLATTATVGTDFKVNPGTLIISSFVANGTGVSPFPATVGQSFSSMTGVIYVFGTGAIPDYKLAPRSLADIVSP